MKPTGWELLRDRAAGPRLAAHAGPRLAALAAGLAVLLLLTAGGAGCGMSGVTGETPEDPSPGALSVSDLALTTVSDTSAVLGWSTSRPAASVVRVGVAANLAVAVTYALHGFTTQHECVLADLEPDTQYFYGLQAIGARGDTASVRGRSFRTDPHHALYDTTPPLLSEVEVISVTSSSALVRWRTDDPCRCTLVYGLGGAGDHSLVEYPGEPAKYTRGHRLTLTDLSPSSSYSFGIQATNLADLSTDGAGASFTTLAAPTLAFCPGLVQAGAGAEFTLSLCLEETRDLAGASVTLSYDPAALEIVGGAAGVAAGPFFYERGGHLFMPPTVDPLAGRARIEASWLIEYEGDEPRGTAADGAGTLCTLRCRWRAGFTGSATQVAFVTLDTDSDGQPDTRLLDFNRLAIRFDHELVEIRQSGAE